jgi:DNA invertase Pin-like site-specific DNA recombinase
MDGIYNPCRPNDRLLGLKGSMSQFELGILRARLGDATQAKARRGELRIPVPIGYIWHRDTGIVFDPDERLQEAIRLIVSQTRQRPSGPAIAGVRADALPAAFGW